jgi:tripeptide aminopeptidase
MQSAIKIASDIVSSLPKHTHSPETTEGKEPFIHPTSINGLIEQTVVKFILRAFTLDELEQMKQVLKSTIEKCMLSYPDSTYTLNITEQYRNMKLVLDKHPEVTSFALEAIRRAGLNPVQSSIRGGTDGSRLSFMGLSCPNIFAGEHAFHSKHEWVSIQDMHKAVETLVHLALIWEEKS